MKSSSVTAVIVKDPFLLNLNKKNGYRSELVCPLLVKCFASPSK